ncbi:hypothetical protein [Microcoleus vaginatus]|uniref:hypothetical protein n=1 Tax=Microcoleus vaginatus TaxID=119532 RepID=UPI00403F7D37
MTLSEAEVRSQKVDELRSQGIEPYPSESYARSHTAKQVREIFSQPGKELENGETDPRRNFPAISWPHHFQARQRQNWFYRFKRRHRQNSTQNRESNRHRRSRFEL